MGHLLKGAYSSICRWFIDDYVPFITEEYNWDWFGGYFEGFMADVFSKAKSLRDLRLDPSEQIISLLCWTVSIIYGPPFIFFSEDLPEKIHEFSILLACIGSTPIKNYGRVWKIFEGSKIKLLFNLSRSRIA